MTGIEWNVNSKNGKIAVMPASTGRPGLSALTPKGERTRQRVIAAAAQLVLDRGVGATTIEDLRAAAGVSSSQAYHYFTDKDALVRAVIDDQAQVVIRGPGIHPCRLRQPPGAA